jgi:DNA-binding protein HU-beta
VNKKEFVDQVAERASLSRADAQRAVEAALSTIEETLKGGGDVTFTGFGKFSVANRAARTGVNPRNPGERVQIAASRVPRFTAGAKLKDATKNGR